MDYFSNDNQNKNQNKRKIFFPLVLIFCIVSFAGVFYIIKDDIFPEDYYGPGMTTEKKQETKTKESSKRKKNDNKDNIETISMEENLGIEESFDNQLNDNLSTRSLASNDYIATTNNVKSISSIDKLAFAGDIYLSKRNIDAYDKGNIYNVLDKTYIDIIDEHDFFVANLEYCLTNSEDATNKEFTFKIDPKYTTILNEMHLDLVTLANNHSMDFGELGFIDTINTLVEHNIDYVGGGLNEEEATKAYIKEINGRKYAIVSATCVVPTVKWFALDDRPGVNSGYYGTNVCNQIKQIKNQVDKVIVFMHWGVEKDLVSTEEQQNFGRRFVEAGADLVLGTHSHRLQEVEYYKNVPIVYGIGNFIFGSTLTDTELLSVSFDYSDNDKGDIKIKLIPGTCGYELTKPLSTDIKRNKFIEENIITKSPTCKLDENGYIINLYE